MKKYCIIGGIIGLVAGLALLGLMPLPFISDFMLLIFLLPFWDALTNFISNATNSDFGEGIGWLAFLFTALLGVLYGYMIYKIKVAIVNKKITAGVAFGVISIIILIVGVHFWEQNRNKSLYNSIDFNNIESKNALSSHGETADWQTYRNEKYGLEIGYPLNFVINQESDWVNSFFVSFGRPNMSSVYSIYIKESNYSNIEDLLKYEIKLDKPIDKRGAYVEDVVENIKISDKPALRITRTSLVFILEGEPTKSMYQTVFAINNNYLYEIRLAGSEDILFYDQILSTSKFIK